eukprot:16432968-Heterocapsa_arctica.AAC.2
MLSSAGCWQSIVNFSVDFLPLTTPFFLRPLTAIVAWAGEEWGGYGRRFCPNLGAGRPNREPAALRWDTQRPTPAPDGH